MSDTNRQALTEQSDSLSAREKRRARWGRDALVSADYYIACAATQLEEIGDRDWSQRADRLMAECIELREEITGEIESSRS